MSIKTSAQARWLAASFACALMLYGDRAMAEGQLTLVNSSTKVAFKAYALKVNDFRYVAGQNHGDTDVLRLCEAIDNSRLIILGMKESAVFRETGAFLFGTPAVAASVAAFFRRGGLMYFEPGSWSVYNSWDGAARRFFSAHGVALPDGSCYINPSKDKDVNIDGKVQNEGDGRLFGKPRDPGLLRAVRHFGGGAAANTVFWGACRTIGFCSFWAAPGSASRSAAPRPPASATSGCTRSGPPPRRSRR